ncbi:MAG: triple tyrosine motif-containing protein [Cyclobacteriaceae bacterium]
MIKIKSILFVSVLILGGLANLQADPRDFSMLVYNADKDFNGVFIYTVIQDEAGFLWIGSDDGLYRFDGNQMLNLNAHDSTINNLVTASVISEDGHLFMGYYEGGISKVEHGRYRKILTSKEIPNKINRLRATENNVVWALTQNQGLVRIQNDQAQLFHLPVFSGIIAYDFFVFGDRIFVGTNEGLLEIQITDDGIKTIGFLESSKALTVNAVYQDNYESHLIWIGTNDGMYSHVKGTKSLDPVSGFPEHVQVTSIAKDEFNTLWVGTKNHGLIEADLEGIDVSAITVFNRQNGFESNQISEVYVDNENEIWVGTFGRGLVQLNRAYFHHYELFASIGVQGMHSIISINEDELILGSENGLVHVYHKPMRDSLIFEGLDFTSQYSVTSLLKDGDKLWTGTQDHGLLRIDLMSKRIERLEINPTDPGSSKQVRTICRDSENNIWVSVAGNGVFRMDSNGNVLEHLNTRNGFYHNEIGTIFCDQAGNLWFGSSATGLALLPKGGEIQYLSQTEIFPAFDVNTITQSSDGLIWVTTQGAGIYSFDGENFKQYTEKDGLLSNYCNAAMVDDIGNVWIGHRLGLSLLQPEYGLITVFNHPGELGETEAERNSVCKDAHGNIFFGNPFGMTKVNMPHFNFRLTKRHTHIKDIRLFYERTNLLDYSESTKLDNVLPDDLEFPYNENHLTFDFVSINLRNPNAIYYQYMLDGYDRGWSPVEKNDHATYTNLDPGNYTFKVKESDHPDLWDDEYTSITFKVRHPYWELWWFYLIEIGVIALVFGVTYYLSSHLKNQFIIRLMVYVSVFIAFEYVHTEMEPFLDRVSGETPIFQVGVNLMLALCLLPIEIKLTRYLKIRAKRIEDEEMAERERLESLESK